jgi:glycosyltransferase involved in cell wall biosynthesis
MNKKILVIASVLKPVNDSRNYEKTAISISKSGNYQIHLVGQKVLNMPTDSSILFNPLFSFSRLSPKRFFTSWVFLNYLFKIKPDIIIITTFELLLPSVLYKILKGKKLIYDVQENYFRNLIYTNSFPFGIKHFLAVGVRALEYATCLFVNHYLLAEKNYEKEFSFTKNKHTVLENKLLKFSVKPRKKRQDDFIQLLYTGTIAENYGVFEAVELAKALHQLDSKIRLKIIGFAAQKTVLEKLKNEIQNLDFITLNGGDNFVAHQEILTAIAEADFGLISYRPDKSTENCIPTKIYEYLAHKLPYLISPNSIWLELTTKYNAGITVDFLNYNAEKILKQLKESSFYSTEPGEEIYWEEDSYWLLVVGKRRFKIVGRF